jgi:hypothetical protein
MDNGDLFLTEKMDILSETRQEEIREVITCLKRFKPTKVAVEVLRENEEALNKEYTSYLNGDFALTVNEVDQIGFRLARECHLKQVHAVDWNEDQEDVPDLESLSEWEDTDAYKEFTKIGQGIISESNTYLQEHSIKDYLLWHNDAQNIARGQEFYMKMALVGSDSNPAGAIWTAKYWYYRNLLIYKNLASLIDSNDERIFVLFGAGHLHLLLQFARESGLFEIELAEDYLR